jgi:NitT/TauT family transport system substrate-binding protein
MGEKVLSRTMVRNIKTSLVVMAAAWLGLLAASQAEAKDRFDLQLRWLDQAQFMGYYVAEANGYYDQEDLDVRLIHGGPGIEPLDSLAQGKADAIVEWLPLALEAEGKGLDVVNVAQFFQRSGLMLSCHRSHGILKPDDLRGKRVAVWKGNLETPLRAWLAAQNTPVNGGEDGVEITNEEGNTETLFDGQTDCISTMEYNEYWELLEQKGLTPQQLVVFRFEELGFSLLEDGLYITRACFDDGTCADKTTRFLRASIRGWQNSIDNPEQAIEDVLGRMAESRTLSYVDKIH